MRSPFLFFQKIGWLLIILGCAVLLLNYRDIAEAVSNTWLINKIQISGGDGRTDADLIQLYNAGAEPLNLKGLRLVKRTKTGVADTTLKSWTADTMVAPGAYYTWANSQYGAELGADITTSGTLAADNCAALRQGSENSGTIVDAVGWGECTSLAESAPTCNPVGAEPIQRLSLTDSDNNAADFSCGAAAPAPITEATATPAGSGSGSSYSPPANYAGQLFINEIYPSPASGEKEWLELYNSGSALSLEGLYLEDNSGSKHKLEGSISGFLVIDSPKCSLNNDGDTIYLKDASGRYLDVLAYGKNSALPAPRAGQSLVRIPDGSTAWQLTATPSKGLSNVWTTIPETTDNAKAEAPKSDLIISEVLPYPNGPGQPNLDKEYIELYNNGKQAIALDNAIIRVDKRQLYKLKTADKLAPGNYLLITRKESKLALANAGGLVEVFEPGRTSASANLHYSDGAEGFAYAWHLDEFGQDSWSWTVMPTPGKANHIVKANEAPVLVWDCPKQGGLLWLDASDSFDPEGQALHFSWQIDDRFSATLPAVQYFLDDNRHDITLTVSDGDQQTIKICRLAATTKTLISLKTNTAKTNIKTATPVKAKKAAVKTTATKKTPAAKVQTAIKTTAAKKATSLTTAQTWRGQVASLPGEFASQYFYLLPEGEEQLRQVYAFNKDFPQLKVGQLIEISGLLSPQSNPPRLKIKQAGDIKIIKDGKLPPAEEISLADLSVDNLGTLVQVSGAVTTKRGQLVYLDDGSGEGSLTLPKAMKNTLKPGDRLSATGLVKASQNSITIALRSASDLQLLAASSTNSSSSTLELPSAPKSNNSYLYTIIGIICLILGIFIWKSLNKKPDHSQGLDKSAKK